MDPIAHHFLLSLDWDYDLTDPVTPYSLHHLVFVLRPPEDAEFPYVVDLKMFLRLTGTGFREFFVGVYALDPGDDDEPEFVAYYGPYAVRFGNEPVGVSKGWNLPRLPFPRPGSYEFRFLHAGEVLAAETIYLFEV